MCFAKAIVTRESAITLEVADVTEVAREGTALRISTLFGEEHLLPAARVARIDLGGGIIDIEEE